MGSTSRRARLGAGAIILATTIVVAACSSGGSPTPAASAASTPPASAAPTTGTGPGIEVGVATDATIGAFLTGENGMTLYIFKKDTGDQSACYDACAASWPPFLVGDGEKVTPGDGATGTFGTTARTDGTTQVTYNGQPLYYFAGDRKAGDTTGQGLNDVWFVAAPTAGAY